MRTEKMSRTRILLSLLIPSAISAIVAITPTAAQQLKKPNIVFMLMDNLGYGELGVYGGGILRGAATPRIDALAAEGMARIWPNGKPLGMVGGDAAAP
jgi:hypothetical protein